MFPDNKGVTKSTMNYTCVINGGVWLLSVIYFFVYGYKHYHGPKTNLTPETVEGEEIVLEDSMSQKTDIRSESV